MTKRYLLLDLEANGFTPTKIWCICTMEYPSGKERSFTDMAKFVEYYKSFDPDKVFIHNGLKYDIPVIMNLIDPDLIPLSKVVDTYVCSQLFDYKKFNTHSLKEIGQYLGVYKGDYTGGFDSYSPEMLDYCVQDVRVLRAIVDMLWKDLVDPLWSEAIKTEQDMAYLCYEMNKNGFYFDLPKASSLLREVQEEKKILEEGFQRAFPPKLVESKRIKYRKTKDGKLFATTQRAMDQAAHYEIKEKEEVLVCYEYKDFNPGSPKDKIDVLWEAGWNPFDKTKGYIKAEREARQQGRQSWYKKRKRT